MVNGKQITRWLFDCSPFPVTLFFALRHALCSMRSDPRKAGSWTGPEDQVFNIEYTIVEISC